MSGFEQIADKSEHVTDLSETCLCNRFSAQDLLETGSQTSLWQDRCNGIWA